MLEKWSRLYGYVRALQLEGRYPRDLGIHLISGMRIDVGWGNPGDAAWPYEKFSSSWPPEEPHGLDEIARKNRLGYYYRVRNSDEARAVSGRIQVFWRLSP